MTEAAGGQGGGANGGGAAGGADSGAAAAAAAAAGGGGNGGGAGGGGDPWFTSADLKLDPDVAKWAEGHKFPSLADALKTGMNAEKVARDRNVLERPDPKNLKAWKGWKELGWTENEGDYKLARPKDLRQGVEYDAGMEDSLRRIAHENRIPLPAAQAMLDGLVGYQNKLLDGLQEAGTRSKADLDGELTKEWGDKTEANRELAKRAAKHFGLKIDETSVLDQIMGSAGLVKFFHGLGAQLGEDKLDGGSGGGSGMTPAQAGVRRRAIESNPEDMKALRDQRHPRHKDVNEERNRLISIEAATRKKG